MKSTLEAWEEYVGVRWEEYVGVRTRLFRLFCIPEPPIRIISGADVSMDLTGYSVGDIRQEMQNIMNIPDDAVPIVNGQLVTEQQIVFNGQFLEFISHSSALLR